MTWLHRLPAQQTKPNSTPSLPGAPAETCPGVCLKTNIGCCTHGRSMARAVVDPGFSRQRGAFHATDWRFFTRATDDHRAAAAFPARHGRSTEPSLAARDGAERIGERPCAAWTLGRPVDTSVGRHRNRGSGDGAHQHVKPRHARRLACRSCSYITAQNRRDQSGVADENIMSAATWFNQPAVSRDSVCQPEACDEAIVLGRDAPDL